MKLLEKGRLEASDHVGDGRPVQAPTGEGGSALDASCTALVGPARQKDVLLFVCGSEDWRIAELNRDCGGCIEARNLRLKIKDHGWLGIPSAEGGRVAFRYHDKFENWALQFSLPLGLIADPKLRLGGRVRSGRRDATELTLWFEHSEFDGPHDSDYEIVFLTELGLSNHRPKDLAQVDVPSGPNEAAMPPFAIEGRAEIALHFVKVRTEGDAAPTWLLGYTLGKASVRRLPRWIGSDAWRDEAQLLQIGDPEQFRHPVTSPLGNNIVWQTLPFKGSRSLNLFQVWNDAVAVPYLRSLRAVDGHRALSVTPRFPAAEANVPWNVVWRRGGGRTWHHAGIQSFDTKNPHTEIPLSRVVFDQLFEPQDQEIAGGAKKTKKEEKAAAASVGAVSHIMLGADAFGRFRGPGTSESLTDWSDRIVFSLAQRNAPAEGAESASSELSWFAGRPADPAGIPLFAAKTSLRLSQAIPAGQDNLADDRSIPEEEARFHVHGETSFGDVGPIVIPLRLALPTKGSAALAESTGKADSPRRRARVGSVDLEFADFPLGAGKESIVARITESNVMPGRSRTIHLELHQTRSSGSSTEIGTVEKEDLLVLDSEPFSVALLRLPRRFGTVANAADSNLFAHWTNRGESANTWQVGAGQTGFEFILPPQAVGEQMVKGREFAKDDLADYRFSPPARQSLSSLKSRQAFAEAPWNLRRLLGNSGQPGAGASVIQMSYELLYGLSCSTEYPYLRLSELAAMIGRSPNRLVPRVGAEDESVVDRVRDWEKLRTLLKGRLAIYEPWDWRTSTMGRREPLTLSEGVACVLRDAADLNYKAKPDSGTPTTEFSVNPKGLKGGVTWGFETASIYHATVSEPRAVLSSVVAPLWSALGGWGDTAASFDKGLTKISAHVDMGFTSTYIVERFGRIGVFWNRAKHVIVYTRTTAPSAQFKPHQESHEGRVLLRKTAEYVEVLEDERRPSGDLQRNPLATGPLRGIKFQSRQMKVLTAWGKDVMKGGTPRGWAVPLWNRAASEKEDAEREKDATREQVYPRPQIFTILAAEKPASLTNDTSITEREGEIRREIQNPEALWFYTEVSKDSDPDSDLWPVVPGLDAPTYLLPPAESAARADVDPMLVPFTLRLFPGSATNVTSERQPNATATVIENVAPFRGSPLVLDPKSADSVGQGVLQAYQQDAPWSGDIASTMNDAVDRLAAEMKNSCVGLQAAADRWRASANEARDELLATIEAGVDTTEQKENAKALVRTHARELSRRLTEFFTGANLSNPLADARQYLLSLKTQILAELDKIVVPGVSLDLEAARTRLNTLRNALGSVPHGPWSPYVRLFVGQLRGAIEKVTSLVQTVSGETEETKTKLENAITTAKGAVDAGHRSAEGILDAVDTQIQKPVAANIGLIQTYFATLETDCSGIIDNAVGSLDAAKSALRTKFEEVVRAPGQTLAQLLPDCDGWVAAIDSARSRARAFVQEQWDKSQEGLRGMLSEYLPPRPSQEKVDAVLGLARAFGSPPTVPQINFDKHAIAYVFDANERDVAVSGVTASMKSIDGWASGVQGNLRTLGVDVNVRALGDRFLPTLKTDPMDLSKVLPNIAGINVEQLLKVKIPPDALGKYVHLSHGLDPKTQQAWGRADIDMPIDPATIFEIGPISLKLEGAKLEAHTTIKASLSGATERLTTARVAGDWVARVASEKVVTFRNTALTLDESGRLNFEISPDRVVLAEAMKFLTELLANLGQSAGLPPIEFVDGGIRVRMDLPVPDTQGVTSGFSGLNIACYFGLRVPSGNLAIDVGLAVGRPDKPFNCAVFVLGGGGYFNLTTTYLIGLKGDAPKLLMALDVAVALSASLALSLGPISGGVAVYLSITARANQSTGGLQMGIRLVIRGDVCIASFINASVVLTLAGRYESNHLKGRGSFSFSVKISFFFTFEVHSEMDWDLGEIGGSRGSIDSFDGVRVASAGLIAERAAFYLQGNVESGRYARFADAYVELFAKD